LRVASFALRVRKINTNIRRFPAPDLYNTGNGESSPERAGYSIRVDFGRQSSPATAYRLFHEYQFYRARLLPCDSREIEAGGIGAGIPEGLAASCV
jgi:hypothetical protein